MKNQRLIVHLLLIFAYAMWGTHGLWVRGITVPATTFTFIDGALGILILLPIMLFTGQIKEILNWRNLAISVGVGSLMTFTVILLYRAMQITTVSNGLLAHWTAPVLVVLFAPFFLKEKREKIFGFALALAIGGLIIMTPLDDLSLANKDVVGILVALASAVVFAGSIIGTKKISGTFSPVPLMFTVAIASFVITGPVALTDPMTPTYMADYSWLFVAKTIVTNIVPFFIYMWAFSKIEAQRVSILGYMEPLSGVVFAAAFLSEVPGWNTVIGGLSILAAGIWIILSGAKREAREAQQAVDSQLELAGAARDG